MQLLRVSSKAIYYIGTAECERDVNDVAAVPGARQYCDQADFPRAFLGIPSSPPLYWIYSLSGYVTALFLSWPDHSSALRSVDDEELLSIDASADGAARSLCMALQSIIDTAWLVPPTTPLDLPLEVMMVMARDVPIWRIGLPLLEPFTAILQDILAR